MGERNGGGMDAFVMKLSPDGVLMWLTQLGEVTRGAGGDTSGNDYCNSIAVDAAGSVYCGGHTSSSLGEENGGEFDAFVVKLNSAGSLVWLTQFGSQTAINSGANSGFDYCAGIAVDGSGNVVCGGYTNGSMGEANGGQFDAFVTKLNGVSGRPLWLTQYGVMTRLGFDHSGSDYCSSVAVDARGDIVCGGHTNGSIGELNGGGFDALVFKVSGSDGFPIWTRQLGSTHAASGRSSAGSDFCASVDLDSSGNVYCGGHTSSSLGDTNAGNYDAFAMKLNSVGNVQWLTQLGQGAMGQGMRAMGYDFCSSIRVGPDGGVFCGGFTDGSLEGLSAGNYDALVMKLEPGSGGLMWVRQAGAAWAGEMDYSGFDYCNGLAVDPDGHAICAGFTDGSMGEPNGGSFDGFVMKLTPAGDPLFLKQLGKLTQKPGVGNRWGHEYCGAVAVDADKNVYCAGYTDGGLVEPRGGGTFDTFVMKLDSTGSVQWVTHLGSVTTAPGGSNAGTEECFGVAVDLEGNVYCAGRTNGSMGEANGGGRLYDAFVMKLSPQGKVLWVKQLGAVTRVPGGSTAGNDECRSVAVDSLGNVYCAGRTSSALGEAAGGNYDAFVMKLDSSGALIWLKQLGGVTMSGKSTQNDEFQGITIDRSGAAYCVGITRGSLGETVGGATDTFVTKFDSNGAITWITQLGATTRVVGWNNNGDDLGRGIAVNRSGEIFVGGHTGSSMGELIGGGYDAFMFKLGSDGKLAWLTQLGSVTKASGGDNSRNDYCHGVGIDTGGNAYCAGYTESSMAEVAGGGGDVSVIKLEQSSGRLLGLTQLGASTGAPGGNVTRYEECTGAAVDSAGSVYCSGYTAGALGEANGGAYDAFVLKLNPTSL